VAFEGSYPLLRRNMRLSEVVAQAGNPTSGAFVEGAYLMRRMTEEEQAQQDALKALIDNQKGRGIIDSLAMSGISLKSVYPVGINLAEALKNPGSDADVVLRDGDVISIPLYNGTVRVMGAVLYPNSITYTEGRNLKYYVKAAGGFDNRARKRRSFVIYMNGMVASGGRIDIRPGCIVVVPSKLPVPPMRWSDVMGLLSSSASTAAVVMSAINLAN
jgi:protein involved in polysaccharide export with SLBB domain